MPKQPTLEVVILAAGLGTRMKSPLPKVLHECCGSSMLSLLMRELAAAAKEEGFPAKVLRFNIVVGHARQKVIEHVDALAPSLAVHVIFSVQDQQLGTAHAVKCALEESARQPSKPDLVAVFNGDLPLYTRAAFKMFIESHASAKSSATMATTELPDATGYGRVLRKAGKFVGSVEHKDATAAQRKIREFNGGVYLFDRAVLVDALSRVGTKNAQKEFYLPDVFSVALKSKKKILAHKYDDADLMRGANNMKELAEAQKILYARIADKWMTEGVFFHDPSVTWVGPEVTLAREVTVGAFSKLSGKTSVGEGTKIGMHCNLNDTKIGARATVRDSVVADDAVIGDECACGPMAHFRPGTKIASRAKIGNFVEIKKSTIGEKTSISHLSYVGDAEIGARVNIGCGFVTCNYDGKNKSISKIGDDVFIGSDSQVVAPIEIAAGTFVASGSTVTESVKERDSLVIARTKQVTKPGYAKKYR